MKETLSFLYCLPKALPQNHLKAAPPPIISWILVIKYIIITFPHTLIGHSVESKHIPLKFYFERTCFLIFLLTDE